MKTSGRCCPTRMKPMSEVSKQQLSALLDGELGADEARFLLRRIQADPALLELWSRYQLMGDVMRHRACMPVSARLATRVMQQIDQEKAPVSAHRSSRWVRYGLGGSIAASVAVAALVWMQPQPRTPASVATKQAAVSSSPVLAEATVDPVNTANTTAVQAPDLGAILRQPGAALLNVQPASAVRSQGPVLVTQPGGAERPLWMPTTASRHHPETFYLRASPVRASPGAGPPQREQHARVLPH